ncbi:MAG: hypothetical protein ACLP0J_31280 [Solirubrobacteraceae bacterium]
MREILPGVYHWTSIHPKIQIEVSSYWLEDGCALIDPLIPTDVGLDWFAERPAAPAAIVLSNRHHYRQSDAFVRRFGCPVLCNRAGMHEFTHGEAVTAFDPGDRLPGGIVAYEIGCICPDETGLYLPAHRALAFADGVVQGGPHGEHDVTGEGGADGTGEHDRGELLGFVPDVLMDDPPDTRRRLLAACARALEELEFEHVLLAHGRPLVGNGRAALEELVRSGGRTAFEM